MKPLKTRYNLRQLMELLEISRWQAYRMMKKYGAKKYLYLARIRDVEPDMYYSLLLVRRHNAQFEDIE